MFRRTLPQVAPPPGENVQRAPGQRRARAGAARAAPGAPSRPGRSTAPATAATTTAAAAGSRSLGAAPSRVRSQRVPFAHFLRSPRLRPAPWDGEVKAGSARLRAPWSPPSTPRPPCRSEELCGRRVPFPRSELATPRIPWGTLVALNRRQSPPPVKPLDHFPEPLASCPPPMASSKPQN